MDSITQAALGAAIGGALAPPKHRRRAMVTGIVLGTLPDLDVFLDYGGPIENFTYHRSFTHSLLVLFPFSILLWALLKRWWTPVSQAPKQWLWIITLALITHPLIDAHTAYGTQLFWPIDIHPTSWATLFIIDPLYTLPLLFAVIVALIRPLGDFAFKSLKVGLVLSTLYVVWSWVSLTLVQNNVAAALEKRGIPDAPFFMTPTPFNTLLWRIVVMTDEGYMEGFDSVILDEGDIKFRSYPSNVNSMLEANEVWAVARLQWFTNGFLRARVEDDSLVLSDLRMGQEPTYGFTYKVAARDTHGWKTIPAERQPRVIDARSLDDVWQRIWENTDP